MTKIILENVLDDNEILDIINNHDVSKYHKILESNKENMINFSVKISKNVKDKLKNKFNLPNLEELTELPLRWIKGDIQPHIDFSSNPEENFKNTYLLYLTDSIGNLIIDNSIYNIKKNTAYIFNEGVYHKTINTNDSYRLMIGPINEYGTMVGTVTTTTVIGVVGIPITSYTIKSNGGVITSYSLSPTTLPSGLSFSTTGLLSGTPIATISSTKVYTITASSNGVPSTTQTFTLEILLPLVFTLSSSTILGSIGVEIESYTITSIGSPITSYSLVGTLPNGLIFDENGLLSGTPTVSLPTTSYTIIAKGTNVPDVSTSFFLNISLPLEFIIL